MLKVIELAFCSYAVTDMARARSFYEGVLGFKPTSVTETPDGKWTEYEFGAYALAIGIAPGWKPSPDGGMAGLEVENFDEAIVHLRAQKVPFRVEPFPTPVCQMAMISDPDGNTICIHKRLGK